MNSLSSRPGVARSAYRRLSALVGPELQVQTKRWLLWGRRRLRAPLRMALLDIPSDGRLVMLVALDADRDLLTRAVARAVALRRDGAAALLVTDCDAFELIRARSLVFEYLPPVDDLRMAGIEETGDVLADRLAAIVAVYRPVTFEAADGCRELPASLTESHGR